MCALSGHGVSLPTLRSLVTGAAPLFTPGRPGTGTDRLCRLPSSSRVSVVCVSGHGTRDRQQGHLRRRRRGGGTPTGDLLRHGDAASDETEQASGPVTRVSHPLPSTCDTWHLRQHKWSSSRVAGVKRRRNATSKKQYLVML